MVILVDLDEVMINLIDEWVLYLNRKYNSTTKLSDIKEWAIDKAFPQLTQEQVFGALYDKELYENVSPYIDAQYYLELLSKEHTIIVVTNTPIEIASYKFNKVLYNNFPYVTKDNVIIASKKYLIDGDILIDDYLNNLVKGKFRKILFTQPHNENDILPEDVERVHNWKEIYEKITGGSNA